MSTANELALIERARAGGRDAFDALVTPHQPMLRGVIRRMIGHPEETHDVVQNALISAWQAISDFRAEARFSTWLCQIGVRAAIDHLRQQERWRTRAQVIYAQRCLDEEALSGEVIAVLSTPAFAFDVHEHIAFCFSCVGRSLDPDEFAAVVLREMLGLSNQEAADAVDVTESVLRHRLSAGRKSMRDAYDGLCSLMNKDGVCYQCRGLRELSPEDRRGPPVPDAIELDERLAIVRNAVVDDGTAKLLHDVFWRRLARQEDQGLGDANVASTDCGA